MTPADLRASAERVQREPFWKHFLAGLSEETLLRLEQARSHEDLLRAQAWHQAANELEAAMRKALNLKD